MGVPSTSLVRRSPLVPDWFYPHRSGWDIAVWNHTEAHRATAARTLLVAAAENLWTIGTVRQAPHRVVVSRRLKNATPTGIWGWDNRWTLAFHPATWYFDEAPEKP